MTHSLFTSLPVIQFPEDFDFDITRAINTSKEHHSDSSEKTAQLDEKASPYDENQSISASDIPGITEDNELDPVQLNKAFRFTAWSSVILVSPTQLQQLCN